MEKSSTVGATSPGRAREESLASPGTQKGYDPVQGVPSDNHYGGQRYKDDAQEQPMEAGLPYSTPPKDAPKPFSG